MTTATLPQHLALFDRIAAHLLAQNAQSRAPNTRSTTSCLYRGPNGRKCAVGFLITDDAYNRSIEGEDVNSDKVIEALVNSGIDAHDYHTVNTLASLQRLHDTASPSEWPKKLEVLRKQIVRFGTSMGPLA